MASNIIHNINRNITNFSAGRMSVNLSNTDTTSPIAPSYNILRSDKTHFFRSGNLSISFTDSLSVESDTLKLFQGKFVGASFDSTKVNMTFIDIYDDLRLKTIGNATSPVVYTNSHWNPADLFWSIGTTYAGLSTLTNTTNPDIDYTSWTNWKNALANVAMSVQAEFRGTTVLNAFRNIADITNSIIIGEADGKIYSYSGYPSLTSAANSYDGTNIFDISCVIDTDDITNKVQVSHANITVGSFTGFQGTITAINTTSVNTFGLQQNYYNNTEIWHSTSLSATEFANNLLTVYSNPVDMFSFTTGYRGLRQQIYDPITLKDNILSLTGTGSSTVFITGINVNVAQGLISFDAETRADNNTFYLDDSVKGLLDFSYNPLR